MLGRDTLPGLTDIPRTQLRSQAILHTGPRLPEALKDLVHALGFARKSAP